MALALPAKPISIQQVAGITTVAVNVLEAPATWRNLRAAVKKIKRHKPKPVPPVAVLPDDGILAPIYPMPVHIEQFPLGAGEVRLSGDEIMLPAEVKP